MGCLSFLPCKRALQNNITFPSPNDYQQPALRLCFKPLQDRQTFRSEIFSLTLQLCGGSAVKIYMYVQTKMQNELTKMLYPFNNNTLSTLLKIKVPKEGFCSDAVKNLTNFLA